MFTYKHFYTLQIPQISGREIWLDSLYGRADFVCEKKVEKDNKNTLPDIHTHIQRFRQ